MTPQMKSQIFFNIQEKKEIWTEINTNFSQKIFSFVSKRIMYTSFVTILVLIVFWWVILEKKDIIDFWFFSVEKYWNPNWVLADYIAEVIQFNWNYSLVRNWLTISNSEQLKLIEDWDVITLSEWTDLLFNLTDWTQAKIVWPAEFSIEKWKSWYQISLVDWKFFRIYCPECVSNIEIVTPDLLIHQEKNQVLDIHIAKEENWSMLVKNDWDNITVTTKDNDNNNKKETTLTSTQLAFVDQNEETIDILKDPDLMSNFMAKNNITATFTLSTDKVEWPTIEQKNQLNDKIAIQPNTNISKEGVNKELQPEQEVIEEKKDPLLEWIIEVISSDLVVTWDLDEEISSELWIVTDKQQVPNQNQMKTLTTNLNTFFLMNIFESIYNNDKSQQNISKLADRINSIASSFWYSHRAKPDLSSIKLTIQSLKNQLEEDRYISPSYILQMEKVSKWCDELSNPAYSNRESLMSTLPEGLKLK